MNLRTVATLVAAALVAGCSQTSVREASNSLASSVPQSVKSGARDAALTAQIVARFAAIDPVSTLHVRVAAQNGDARFAGTVASAATLGKFSRAAAGVAGIRRVTPQVTIRRLEDPGRSVRDAALVATVQASLAGQGGIDGLRVRAHAHDGIVTLEGPVRDRAMDETLLDAARRTSGVRRVVDRLRLER